MRTSDWRSYSNAPIKNERRVDESRRLRAWQTQCSQHTAPVCRNAPQRRALPQKPAAILCRCACGFVAALAALSLRWRCRGGGYAAALAALPLRRRSVAALAAVSHAAIAGLGGSGGSLGLIGQLIRLVGAFPGELGLGASEVSIGGCLLIDRPYQVQHLAQSVGREIEMLADQLRQPLA